MSTKDCKIEQYTEYTCKITAPLGYHFVRKEDNENMGLIVYEAINTNLADKYRLELNNYLNVNL